MCKTIVDESVVIGDLCYRLANEKDREDIIEAFFTYMMQDEPCTASRGGYTDRHPGLIHQVDELLSDGFTPVAIDIKTKQIVGAALSHVYDKDRYIEDSLSEEEYRKIYPMTHVDLMKMCDDMYTGKELLELYPEVSSVCDLFVVGTHPNFRRRGIGSELIRQLIKAAKIGGCQAISLLATSDYTRRICENDGGWVVFKERSWEFYRESSTGKPLFPLVKSNKLTAHIKRI